MHNFLALRICKNMSQEHLKPIILHIQCRPEKWIILLSIQCLKFFCFSLDTEHNQNSVVTNKLMSVCMWVVTNNVPTLQSKGLVYGWCCHYCIYSSRRHCTYQLPKLIQQPLLSLAAVLRVVKLNSLVVDYVFLQCQCISAVSMYFCTKIY